MSKKGFEKLVFGVVAVGFLFLLYLAGVGAYAMFNAYKLSAKWYELSLGLMWSCMVMWHAYKVVLLNASIAAIRGQNIKDGKADAQPQKAKPVSLTGKEKLIKVGPEMCSYGNILDLIDEIKQNKGRYSYDDFKEMKKDLEKSGFGDVAFKDIKNLMKPWERNPGLPRNYPNPEWSQHVPYGY